MKRLMLIMAAFLCVAALTGCSGDGVYTLKILNGGELVLNRGEYHLFDVILLDGRLRVDQGASLYGNVYQVLGNFDLEGDLSGNLFLLSGQLQLGQQAKITGDVQHGGGEIIGSLQQAVEGEIIDSQMRIPLSPEWLAESLAQQWGWLVAESLLVTGMAIILAMSYPTGLKHIGMAAGRYGLACAAMGVLAGIVGISLLVQMLFTILLIPVSLLGVLLLLISIAIGWSSFGWFIGDWLCKRLELNLSMPLQAGIGSLLFMFLINMFDLLPGIGDLMSLITGLIGLGAVFLTRVGLRQFVPANLEN